MSGAVMPQWKVALQQKLDKKKDDERRKLLEEEQRRLEALPPWKRMTMVPQNVIIISGGTTTVSKLSTDSDTTTSTTRTSDENTQKKPSISNNSQVTKATTNRKESETRTSVSSVQHHHENHVMSSDLTNHIAKDETDAGKPATVTGREGVDEEHVASVLNNPFLKFDGGARRHRVSPSSRSDDKERKYTSSKTTDFIKVAKKQPDNTIRQRSRSASPRRAAKEHNVDLEVEEEDDLPQTRSRKNSVSDLRSRFGHAASVDDLKIVSRKTSESDMTSPLSPQSPTTALDRNKLFDTENHKVHITFKQESPQRLAHPSAPKVPTSANSATSEKLPSSSTTRPQTQKSTVVRLRDSTPSKLSETKSISVVEAKVAPTSNGNRSTKRQAPKPPSSESSLGTKIDVTPTKTVTPTSSLSSNAVKTVNDSEFSNKPVESSNGVSMTNEVSLPEQPKTAILGDGQSSLRRKKGISKMSASALISLSSNDSSEVQLSEHNARVRAARQEARSSSSKNSLRSARESESRDTDSIPKGVVSSNAFGSKLNTSESKTSSVTKPKEDDSFIESIPYPDNFRQPKKESTYVDTIPYPENFRKPKSNSQEASETNTPSVKLVPSVKKPIINDIPRTNIDEVILAPIEEDESLNLTNGTVEEKAPPRKIKKKSNMEWIGYNTPTGKPSALKSSSKSRTVNENRITFNEANLSETFEYQSESSLLNEYLREERGMNGNPRVGNLPRQEARDEEDDDIDSTPSSQSSIDNVLAHEGLQSYTPKDLQNFSPMSMRLQTKQETPKPKEEAAPSPVKEDPDPDDIAITYDDTGDYFSSAGSSTAALLF